MTEMRTLIDEARNIARDAHADNFDLRRITGAIDDVAIYLVDNNPYADDAGRREREHAALKMMLRADGLEVAAVARFPLGGEDAEYTVAIVFELASFEGTIEAAEERLILQWETVRYGDEAELFAQTGALRPTHFTRTGRGIRVIKGGDTD